MNFRFKTVLSVALSFFLITACSYSQLGSIKRAMADDIESGRTIDWSRINRSSAYRFRRHEIPLEDGMTKWIFSNIDGCEVVLFTHTDGDGDSIVTSGHISSDEEKCDKRLPLSNDIL